MHNIALITFLFYVLYLVEPSFIGLFVGLTGLWLKASARVTLHLRFPVEFLTTIGALVVMFSWAGRAMVFCPAMFLGSTTRLHVRVHKHGNHVIHFCWLKRPVKFNGWRFQPFLYHVLTSRFNGNKSLKNINSEHFSNIFNWKVLLDWLI